MTISISLDIDAARVIGTLTVLPEFVNLEATKAMEVSTFIVEAEVKALTPRKTGRLFSGWQSRVSIAGGLTGIIANRVSYAGYVEDGTQPHDIEAHGAALKIPLGRRTLTGAAAAGEPFMFRKRVHHPGTHGAHMGRRGLALAKPHIHAEFRRAMKHAVELSLGK